MEARHSLLSPRELLYGAHQIHVVAVENDQVLHLQNDRFEGRAQRPPLP
jgi:hypothetical protein